MNQECRCDFQSLLGTRFFFKVTFIVKVVARWRMNTKQLGMSIRNRFFSKCQTIETDWNKFCVQHNNISTKDPESDLCLHETCLGAYWMIVNQLREYIWITPNFKSHTPLPLTRHHHQIYSPTTTSPYQPTFPHFKNEVKCYHLELNYTSHHLQIGVALNCPPMLNTRGYLLHSISWCNVVHPPGIS